MRLIPLVLAALLLCGVASADDGLAVDVRFDKTGDGLVDASDWKKMTEEERAAYARASVEALGEDPDVMLTGGETRAARYLKGLRAVYE